MTSLVDVATSNGSGARAYHSHQSTEKHIELKKVITMERGDQIWRLRSMVHNQSGNETVASATVFSGELRCTPKNTEVQMLTKMNDPGTIRKVK